MSRRTRTITLIAIILTCIVALIVIGIRGNVIYYYGVSEAIEKASSQGTTRFRLAGAVVDGTIHTDDSSTQFQLTDGKVEVEVVHHGDPPELFKNGAPIVAEGHWQKDKIGKIFVSDRIMIKHGNEYSPPKVEQENNRYVDDSASLASTTSTTQP